MQDYDRFAGQPAKCNHNNVVGGHTKVDHNRSQQSVSVCEAAGMRVTGFRDTTTEVEVTHPAPKDEVVSTTVAPNKDAPPIFTTIQ